jgi:hypothetical protein
VEPDVNVGRIGIDRGTSRAWVEVAHSSRILQELLTGTPPAVKGSPLAITNQFFPKDPVERWCRSYLSAALEHLNMWADLVAPMHLHPEAEVHHTPRPAQTLARAALESASQAVWILSADNPREMARRHISLVLDDWDQQRKAALDPSVKSELKARQEEVRELLSPAELDLRAPTYLALVTSATREVRDNLASHGLGDPAEVERLWRASAGSAHGKMWPAIELRVSIEVEGRTYTFPDATAMSAMLVLAEKVTSYGVARFIDRAGHEPGLTARLTEASDALYRRIPKIAGAPETMTRLPKSEQND